MSYLIQIQLAKTLCLAQFTFKAHCSRLFSSAVSEWFPRHYNSLFLRKSRLITFIIILVTTIHQQKTSDYWFFGLFFKYVWRSSSSSIQNFWGVIKFFYRLRLGKVWISNETTLLSGILELSMMVNGMLFSNHHDFDFCVIFFLFLSMNYHYQFEKPIMGHFGVTKSRALKIKPFTIFTWTIMHLVFPPKFYVTVHCLQFFLGI